MKRFYSHGKLLLSGEYLILDGALGLALPTSFGQDLNCSDNTTDLLLWESFNSYGKCWLRVEIDVVKKRIIYADCFSEVDGGNEMWAETLFDILLKANQLNTNFLTTIQGKIIRTSLSFSRNWGLGSSSTLINNLANLAEVNAFELLSLTFGGSGYDVACAQHGSPILYKRTKDGPQIEQIDFNPPFASELFFVHLNKKQDSRLAIQKYKEYQGSKTVEIDAVSKITRAMAAAKTLSEFEWLMEEHERILSSVLQQSTVQDSLFSDYPGKVKSLGAWGGDFVLATQKAAVDYFKNKGFETLVPYTTMVLHHK